MRTLREDWTWTSELLDAPPRPDTVEEDRRCRGRDAGRGPRVRHRLESEVYVETAYQNREKLKPAGKGRITIDSGAAESVLPVGMLPGEETVEGDNKRKGVRYVAANSGTVQEERLRGGQLHHVPGDWSQQAARVRQPDP